MWKYLISKKNVALGEQKEIDLEVRRERRLWTHRPRPKYRMQESKKHQTQSAEQQWTRCGIVGRSLRKGIQSVQIKPQDLLAGIQVARWPKSRFVKSAVRTDS
jgi:hypothetical protein